MPGRPVFAFPRQRPDGGRRRVELVDAVLLDDLPAPVGSRVGRNALEHDRRGAVAQGAVDDVGMSRDPADVRAAEVDVAVMVIEDVAVGNSRVYHVSTDGMLHALWLARGPGGIENEQGILRVHLLARAVGVGPVHQVMPPEVPAFLHGELELGIVLDPVDHDAGGDRLAHLLLRRGHGFVRHRFHEDRLVAAMGPVGGDDRLAGRIHDTVRQRIGREPAEHDGMDRADPGAGQHGDGQFGDHGEVDRNPVALPDVPRLEHVGELADLFVQFPVGEARVLARLVAFPYDGRLVAARLEMAVDAVMHDVGLAAFEPLDGHGALPHIVVVGPDPVPFPEPVERFRLLGPEGLRVGDGTLVFPPVFVQALQVRLVAKSFIGLIQVGHVRSPGHSLCLRVMPVFERS